MKLIAMMILVSISQFTWTVQAESLDNQAGCRRMTKDLGLKAEGLFTAIYRWKLKPGMDAQFREGWAGLTRLIHQYQGSLGSRLHQAEDGTWMAYAQWPSKDLWEKAGLQTREAIHHRKMMRDAVEMDFPDVLLTVTDDLLADPTTQSH